MAESKVFQIFLLISFVILSTHALTAYLTEAISKGGFNYRTEIFVGDHSNGSRYYKSRAENRTFEAKPNTTKVVVYIRNEAQFTADKLAELYHGEMLWQEFLDYGYQLIYLIVYDFQDGDERVISEFLDQSIKPDPHQNNFHVYTIGEGDMDLDYKTLSGSLDKYKDDDENVFGGNLHKYIRDLYIQRPRFRW